MNLEKYSITSDHHHLTYEFLSQGPNGTIKKVVQYQKIGEDVYNLALGDWDEANQKINTNVRSNNDDRDKVLTTVASTVIDFIKYYPAATIFAQGITPGKTRLYQMGINSNWREISLLFDVQGFFKEKNSNGNWEPFEQRKNYQAFALKAK
jgi:hypothetical protein